MSRYVVLREPDGEFLPMGVAVERDQDVTIIAIDEYGLPKRVREPYKVLQRDLSAVEYKAGDPGYFEQVLVELQRLASIGKSGSVEDVDRETLIELYNEEVVKPRLAAPRVYEAAPRPDWQVRAWHSDLDAEGSYDDAFPRVAA